MLPTSRGPRNSRRRTLLWAGAACVVGYAAYQAYQTETVQKKKKDMTDRLDRFLETVQNYSEALSSSSRIFSTVLKDLLMFLTTDTEEVPQSIRQLARLMRNRETVQTVKTYVLAALDSSPLASPQENATPAAPSLLDRLLFSEKGQNLVSLVVARAARETVATVLESMDQQAALGGAPLENSPPVLEFLTDRSLGFLSTAAGREIAVQAVSALVASAVSVYLEKTSSEPVLEKIVSHTLTQDDTRKALEQVMGYVGKEVVVQMLSPIKSPPPGSARYSEEPAAFQRRGGDGSPLRGRGGGFMGEEVAGPSGGIANYPRPKTPANGPGSFRRNAGALESAVATSLDERLLHEASFDDFSGSSSKPSAHVTRSQQLTPRQTAAAAPLSQTAATSAVPRLVTSGSDLALQRYHQLQQQQHATAAAPSRNASQSQLQLRPGAAVSQISLPAATGPSAVGAAPQEATWQSGVVREVMKMAMQPEGRLLVKEVASTITTEALKTFLSYMNPFSRLHRSGTAAPSSSTAAGRGTLPPTVPAATSAGLELTTGGIKAFVQTAAPPSRRRMAHASVVSDGEEGEGSEISLRTSGTAHSTASPVSRRSAYTKKALSSFTWLAGKALSTGCAAAEFV